MEGVKDKVKERLGYGLENEADLLSRAGENTTRKSIALGITSRGIGFGVLETYRYLTNYGDPRLPDIYKVYRIALYCFEAKARSVVGTVVPLGDNVADETQRTLYPTGFFLSARTISGLPKQIAMIINAIGVIKAENCTYYPVLPKDIEAEVNGATLFCPQPDRVILSNLRKTVVALADPAIPVIWRQDFFARSPIPGMIVVNNLLINPDEIMPDGYDEQMLMDDIRELGNLNPIIQKFATKLSGALLSWDPMGGMSLLITTGPSDMKAKLRNGGQELDVYYRTCNPLGDAKDHWCMHEVTQADKMVGIIAMTGELPVYENLEKPLFTIRAQEIASYVVTASREATTRLLFA